MQCSKCSVPKLSKEFYRDPLTNKCEHVTLYCAKCLLGLLRLKAECPTCNTGVPSSVISKVEEFTKSFIVVQTPAIQQDDNANDNTSSSIRISLLDGQTFEFPYSKITTIQYLKNQIKLKINVEPEKQQLSYQNTQLKAFNDKNDATTLGTYNIPANATLQLIVLMLAIPDGSNLQDIVFDLHWGYPLSRKDYLDGTCFLWGPNGLVGVADYRHLKTMEGVTHSGDQMDDPNRTGHHKIVVSLRTLPQYVTQLYFILSSWDSPTIASFQSPTVSLFDVQRPTQQLTKYSIQSAKQSQAVIMCRLVRKLGGWNVETVGRMSKGNAANYEPIVQSINNMP